LVDNISRGWNVLGYQGMLGSCVGLHLVLNSKTSWAHWGTVCPGSGLRRWHDAPWLLQYTDKLVLLDSEYYKVLYE